MTSESTVSARHTSVETPDQIGGIAIWVEPELMPIEDIIFRRRSFLSINATAMLVSLRQAMRLFVWSFENESLCWCYSKNATSVPIQTYKCNAFEVRLLYAVQILRTIRWVQTLDLFDLAIDLLAVARSTNWKLEWNQLILQKRDWIRHWFFEKNFVHPLPLLRN